MIIDRDDRVVAHAGLGLGQERGCHRRPTPWVQNRSRYRATSCASEARPTTTSWMPSSNTANIVRASRWDRRNRCCARADRRAGPTRAQRSVVELRQPPMLTHEHARVTDGARQREHVEQLEYVGPQRLGSGTRTDTIRQHIGADTAVLGEEREEKIILGAKARVERLERQARPAADLRHREGRAPRLVGERTSRGYEAIRPPGFCGECHSPPA